MTSPLKRITTLLTLQTLVLLTILYSVANAAEQTEPRAKAFTLEDRNEIAYTVEFPREKPIVLHTGDKDGSKDLRPWVIRIYKTYGEAVDQKAVAQLESVPRLMRGMVRRRFFEEDSKVLLDWTGEVTHQLDCKPSVANIIVVAPDGQIIHRAYGAITEEGWEPLHTALLTVAEPAPPDQDTPEDHASE